MKTKPEALYLDLLKEALAFSLWPEPPAPFNAVLSPYAAPSRSLPKRLGISLVSRALARRSLVLCRQRSVSAGDIREGKYWPAYADTMIGLASLDNIQSCVETVLEEKVEGDLIETGVWRGGACILMRGILAAYGVEDRKVYAADSFGGLPKPEESGHAADKDSDLHAYSILAVPQSEVEKNFEKYGLLDDQVVFLKGWFKDTLPQAAIDKLALLRLDGDMYGSTMDALVALYPKLSEGGFCIVDDYHAVSGCKMAVDDYRSENGIECEMHPINWAAVYWRKG